MKQLIFLICIISLLACSKKEMQISSLNPDVFTIELPQTRGELNLYEIIDSYRYVKLELSNESLIGEVSLLEYYDEKYYILDASYSMSLFVFDKNGNYLWKIDRIGNGPGEYSSLSDFSIDYDNQQIHLLSLRPSKVLVFDMQGNFIEEKQFPFYTNNFTRLTTNDYAFYNGYRKNRERLETECNLIITDNEMNIKYSYFPYSSENRLKIPYPQTNFYTYNGEKYFFDSLSASIYSIKADSLIHCYQINLNEYSFNDKKLYSSKEEYQKYQNKMQPYELTSMQENDRFLYFTLSSSNKQMEYCFYSKDKNELYWGNQINNFLKKPIDLQIKTSYDDYFISVFSPLSLFQIKEILAEQPPEIRDKSFENNDLKKLLINFNEEDNPVLIIFKMREI